MNKMAQQSFQNAVKNNNIYHWCYRVPLARTQNYGQSVSNRDGLGLNKPSTQPYPLWEQPSTWDTRFSQSSFAQRPSIRTQNYGQSVSNRDSFWKLLGEIFGLD